MLEGCTLHFNLDLSVLLAGRTTLLDRQRAPKWGSLRIFLCSGEGEKSGSSSISLFSSFLFLSLRILFFRFQGRYDRICSEVSEEFSKGYVPF